MNSFLPAEVPQNSTGWTAKTAGIGASFQKMHHSIIIFVLEDKFQNQGKFLFRFSRGCNVTDQRSGDGRLSGFKSSARELLLL